MAGDEFGEKQHAASDQRRRRAREEGNVVKSQDLASAALLATALVGIWFQGAQVAEAVARITRRHLEAVYWSQLDIQTLTPHLLQLGGELLWSLGPLIGLLFLAAIAVHGGQIGFLFLPQKLAADWERINPLNNWGRIASLTNVVQLGFGILKVLVIGVVAGIAVWDERQRLLVLSDQSSPEIAAYLFSVLFWTTLKIASALLILALFDYGFMWWKNEQDLMMTHQELREEIKEQEGDPEIAKRRKQLQRASATNRLHAIVPKADVVVTNPTELAIALQYDHEKMAAPVVIAKGAGVIAQQIRRLALEHGVAVVERKELARALHQLVEVNHPVPAEQYAAVAEVIRYVYQLKGKKLPGART